MTYNLFHAQIYPSDEERKQWDNELAEKIRVEREEAARDERTKKLFEQQQEAIRAKALADVDEAWSQSYHEVSMNLISGIVAIRESDPAYVKSKSKVGWGCSLTEAHKKAMFHIFTAGMDGEEVQTSLCRRRTADYLAKTGGIILHVPLNPIRECMVACIQFGRGLDGLRPKETCELILEYERARERAKRARRRQLRSRGLRRCCCFLLKGAPREQS
jgi:hypothetical protein